MTTTNERLLLAWTPDELPSVKTVVLGSTVLGFFEGTSGWAGEMAGSDDPLDRVIHAVFDTIRRAPRGRDGAVRLKLSTRQVVAVLYYADVMQEATDPASTGSSSQEDPAGYAEFVAAKRLMAQIAKKWPDAKL